MIRSIYQMTKALFDHLMLLVQPQPVAKDIDVAEASFRLPIPLHLAPERYYQ